MSLYDDVVTDFDTGSTEAQSDTAASNWGNGNFKLMQMQVEAAKKRQSLTKIKPAFTPKATNIAPVIDLSDKRGKPGLQLKKEPDQHSYTFNPTPSTMSTSSTGDVRFNTITGKIERGDDLATAASIYSNSTEEYDPRKPNDYEKLLGDVSKSNRNNKENDNGGSSRRDDKYSSSSSSRRRHNRSRSRDRGRKKDRRRIYSSDDDRSRSRSRNRSHRSRDNKKSSKNRRYSSSSDDSDSGHSSRKRKNDDRNGKSKSYDDSSNKRQNMNAFAPPPSLLEDTTIADSEDKKAEAALPTKSLFGSLKAEKMMAKMGYKEGDGLGRNKQGMSIALQVEKTGKRIGRIIHEKDVVEAPILPPEPIVPPAPLAMGPPAVGIPADVMKNMSKVVLLKNMVGPGDVDDELEAETKEECAKYGEVNKCLIYEIPNVAPEEAVRIFLEFKTLPSAIKALTDLNGRFFGGRAVKATFYNLDRFKNLELAD